MNNELEEAAEKYLQECRLLTNIHLSNPIHAERCKNNFIAGAKYMAERMYSEEEMKYNKNVYFQPDFSCEETLITPDGVELWSYYVYASFDNARRDFPERQIIAYKGDDIEDPYFIDGNGNY